MTVLEVIQRSTEFLTQKGVESARLQTELLLAHVLQLPRMQLYLKFDRPLAEAELAQMRELVKRRGQREPLQQIVGSTSFCGLEMAVNRDVLIPRPETELLAERGWQFLQGLSAMKPGRLKVLDLGTGSGCLAITLAVKCPNAELCAVDLSAGALEVARQNAERHGVASRIQFVQGDNFEVLVPGASFDLIVSNPPYIPTGEIDLLQPEVRDHDPRTALDGGLDGMDFYRHYAAHAAPWLSAEGKIMLEFGDDQAGSIRRLFEEQNWIVEVIAEDYTQTPRILVAKMPGASSSQSGAASASAKH